MKKTLHKEIMIYEPCSMACVGFSEQVRNGGHLRLRAGASVMPNDLPPWHTVYQQARRWIAAGVFEDMGT
jgi:hypothetical protein